MKVAYIQGGRSIGQAFNISYQSLPSSSLSHRHHPVQSFYKKVFHMKQIFKLSQRESILEFEEINLLMKILIS